MKPSLSNLIDEFISQRRESDGGWPEVSEKDMEMLEWILDALIDEKWEQDADGDYPVKWVLVDKTKHRFPSYAPVPLFPREDATKEQRDEILRILNMNLQISADSLDTAIRIFTDKR